MWRVVWKDSLAPRKARNMAPSIQAAFVEEVAKAIVDVPLAGKVEPVFSFPARVSDEAWATSEAEAQAIGELPGFLHAFVNERDEAEILRNRLVESFGGRVEIEGQPVAELRPQGAALRSPLAADLAATPDLSGTQGYLDPASVGVDARFAWTVPGGTGRNINVIDIEWGWNFLHEDLTAKSLGQLLGVHQDQDHGTAVLGVIGGDDNGLGVMGIALEAFVGSASPALADGTWNVENTILQVAAILNPGNVILLELQTSDLFPYEKLSSVFSAIQTVVSQGIYVVEVAGNGGRDLDSFGLTRAFDSGAILVGAGGAGNGTNPRVRRPFSNFGSRVDVQGWGENVVTCGGVSAPEFHDLVSNPDPSRCYTQSFRETSSAAAIVAGAVACIAGAIKDRNDPPLSPSDMRDLLMTTGQDQMPEPGVAAMRHIGPLPDLQAALRSLGLA